VSARLYQNTLKDQNGAVLRSASVTVYLAGTTTLATIYATDPTPGGVSAVSGSVVTTDTDGYFSFWISLTDYTGDQEFKIIIVKSGYGTKTYDYIPLLYQIHAPGLESIGNLTTAANKIIYTTALDTYCFLISKSEHSQLPAVVFQLNSKI